jgi:hypothetical protein
MKRKRGIIGILVAICLMVVTSCLITTLDSVWKDPNYQGGKLNKVLVVGVAKRPTVRRLFEDKFIAELKVRGTDALSSYTIIPQEGMLDKATVESKVKTLGVDAVLVTRLVNRKKERTYTPSTYHYGGWYGRYSRGYGYVTSPGYYTEYETVNLETNIYETQTDKLIWSALSDTVLGGSVEVEIESLVKVIIKSLSDNQLIG